VGKTHDKAYHLAKIEAIELKEKRKAIDEALRKLRGKKK